MFGERFFHKATFVAAHVLVHGGHNEGGLSDNCLSDRYAAAQVGEYQILISHRRFQTAGATYCS